MRKLTLAAIVPVLLVSATASAHFDLIMPPSSAKTTEGGKGSPPCGPDAAEGTATPVMGGTQLMLNINETVRHGGFYRVALALTSCHKDPANGPKCFPADNTVYDKDNKVLMAGGAGISDHADSTATPVFPILGDNLFQHPDPGQPAKPTWTGMVPIPNVTCEKCTLQVIEFMAPHGSNGDAGFFYHHCADLKITADPNKPIMGAGGSGGGGAGGAAGAGGTGGAAAGAGGAGGATTGGTGTSGSGGSGGSPTGAGGTTVPGGTTSTGGVTTTPVAGNSTGGTGVVTTNNSDDSGGCGIASHSRGGASALAALGLLFALVRRRRAR